ncbi:MAG: hypothetical protein ACK4LB_03905 [Spirosomataceae bacterium]
MKKWMLFLSLISLGMGCVPASSPQQGASLTSAEVEARQRTDQMKVDLALNTEQTDKVYLATVVHIRTIRKLRAANETDKIPATDQSYSSEIQKILTSEQYTRFKSSYGY